MNERYNTGTDTGYIKALDQLHYYKSKSATIELKEIKQTRSNLQNRAIHLWFTFCADALNSSGEYFQYLDYKNVSADMPWSGEMFKTYWIRPIIKVLYDIDSTTKLKTNEIDQLIDVISKRFAENGLTVNFPSSFDIWIKNAQY